MDWVERSDEILNTQVEEIKEILLGISLQREREDRWLWISDPRKQFTVKCCYAWLTELLGDEEIGRYSGELQLAYVQKIVEV